MDQNSKENSYIDEDGSTVLICVSDSEDAGNLNLFMQKTDF